MNPIHEMCEDSLWRPTKTEHIRLELDTATIIQIESINEQKVFTFMRNFGDSRPLSGYECR